jgi:hypothetical protein
MSTGLPSLPRITLGSFSQVQVKRVVLPGPGEAEALGWRDLRVDADHAVQRAALVPLER